MNKNLKIGAIVAIVAAIGAMGGLTSVSFLQQAEAASCQFFFDADGNRLKEDKCSSDNSLANANAFNANVHIKGLKN
jgi:hypothetical protein